MIPGTHWFLSLQKTKKFNYTSNKVNFAAKTILKPLLRKKMKKRKLETLVLAGTLSIR